jgi:Tfp pilus assembly protein PilF/4-amino-4-deoxy-L-arabinose transferase-like glycosyltransferase
LIGIFLLALVVRSIHVAAIGATPFARLLIGDARSYDQWATAIAAGDWIGKQTFYQAPLYPYALATLYATVGRDPMTVRWVQAVVGSLACVLLAYAGRRWLSARVGLVAGTILAIYPPAIFFDGLIQKAALDNLIMCALLAVLGAYVMSRRDTLLTVAGAVLGLFALTRENALVFFVILAAWLPFHLAGQTLRKRVSAVGLLVAGIAVILFPVGLRNWKVGGEFLITTSQAGPNFYIGNHEGATGRYIPIRPDRDGPEFERIDATEVAEQAVGHKLTPGGVSSYWWSRSAAWMRAHPGDWAALAGRKVLLTWNSAELPDTESLEVYRDYSPVLNALSAVLGFATLLTFAAPGMLITWRASPRPTLLYMMCFGFAAAVAAFYVFARYRYPMVPILVLFAATALVTGFDAARAGNWRPSVGVVGATLAGATLACLPMVPAQGSRWAGYNNLGYGFASDRNYNLAATYQRKAIELQPSQAGPHYDLATALTQLEHVDEAVTELETTLRLDPNHAPAHDDLGVLLARRGDFADAERHFLHAYRIDPSRPSTVSNLGGIALVKGRADEAVGWFQKAVALGLDNVNIRLNLMQALERLGRRDEALGQAREVLKSDPTNAIALKAVDRLR